jgi:hypothetical protein
MTTTAARATAAAGTARHCPAVALVAGSIDPGAFRRQSNAPNCGILLRAGLAHVAVAGLPGRGNG